MVMLNQVEVNTIGDIEARASFRVQLQKWLKQDRVFKQLSEEDKKRVETNPLRVLDSKTFSQLGFEDDIPRLEEHLSAESKHVFKSICHGLDTLGIAYKVNHNLVRGLDYYNDFCFEVKPEAKGTNKQSTLLAGGRYDLLLSSIAKDTRRNFKAVGLRISYLKVCNGN